jgi:hypothetical protein
MVTHHQGKVVLGHISFASEGSTFCAMFYKDFLFRVIEMVLSLKELTCRYFIFNKANNGSLTSQMFFTSKNLLERGKFSSE